MLINRKIDIFWQNLNNKTDFCYRPKEALQIFVQLSTNMAVVRSAANQMQYPLSSVISVLMCFRIGFQINRVLLPFRRWIPGVIWKQSLLHANNQAHFSIKFLKKFEYSPIRIYPNIFNLSDRVGISCFSSRPRN